MFFNNPCAVLFIVFVIIIAFGFLFIPRKEKETPPEDHAQTIYRMCRNLLGVGVWADFKMTKLTIDKDGDEITITLVSGDVVFSADGAVRMRDRTGYDDYFATEINEYHPGAWVQYLITEYEEIMRDRERDEKQRKSEKFAKVDDSELFGVK